MENATQHGKRFVVGEFVRIRGQVVGFPDLAGLSLNGKQALFRPNPENRPPDPVPNPYAGGDIGM